MLTKDEGHCDHSTLFPGGSFFMLHLLHDDLSLYLSFYGVCFFGCFGFCFVFTCKVIYYGVWFKWLCGVCKGIVFIENARMIW